MADSRNRPRDEDEEQEHYEEHEAGHELTREELEDALDMGMELESQSQIFLEMRAQNLELLKVAASVCGYGGEQDPLKPGELKNVIRMIEEVYSVFYGWIDPEEAEEDEDEDDD